MIKFLIVSLLAAVFTVPLQTTANPCTNGVCGTSNPMRSFDSSAQFTTPNPSVVRIVVENSTSRNYGTGTWIQNAQNQHFILTCAHLFESTEIPQQIVVFFPNSSMILAKLHAIDRTWDLALLDSETPSNGNRESGSGNPPSFFPEGIRISGNVPKAGDTLFFAGYGNDGRYRVVNGKLYGYCRIGRGKTSETLVISGQARNGDSGGPILDLQGNLVGVLWGTDSRTVCGTYLGRIQNFLKNALPMRESKPKKTQVQDSSALPQAEKSEPPRIFRNSESPRASDISGENSAEILKSLRELRELRQGKSICQRLRPWYSYWIPDFSDIALFIIVLVYICRKFHKKWKEKHENTQQNS